MECSLIALKTSRFIKDSSGEVLFCSGVPEAAGEDSLGRAEAGEGSEEVGATLEIKISEAFLLRSCSSRLHRAVRILSDSDLLLSSWSSSLTFSLAKSLSTLRVSF